MKHQARSATDLPPEGVNKWEALRELATARTQFGLTDRDMTVLQALVSFHQETILGGNNPNLIVHPSNKAICERLNGMPASTMRRHLSHLVASGVITRRDSPNGKRYARHDGDHKEAFGFDLSPLVRRFADICTAAEEIRAHEQRHRRLREAVSLMRRDLAALAEYGSTARPDLPIWDRFSDMARLAARDLRRKLSLSDLDAIGTELRAALNEVRDLLEPRETEELSTSESNIEQLYQNSKTDSYESEPCKEKPRVESDVPDIEDTGTDGTGRAEDDHLPNIPLGLVLASCREIQTYADGQLRHWHDLVTTADRVRPMMGISQTAWDEAKRTMGPEEAAAVVAAMLERFAEIRSPGGYLRHLSNKASVGEFSCGPMIMALLRRDAA